MHMNDVFNLIVVIALFWLAWRWRAWARGKRQERYIDDYRFHPAIRKKLQDRHPQLTETEIDLVFQSLRHYFQVCRLAGKHMVSMPSQVVDDAWHEFILFTRAYQTYCQKALGRFLHHVPAEAMRTPTLAQEGIKRAWRLSCHLEKINPRTPHRLPQLFAIDSLLNIHNGFKYRLNCQDRTTATAAAYCATHIGCGGGCGGGCAGSPDSGGDGGDGGGDGGCGGGCGGGD